MAGLNKAMIIGNVGMIEARTTSSGPVVNLSIATSRPYTNKEGQTVDDTQWHNVVAFKHLAEIIDKYVKKGHKLYIEGSLKTETYTDKEGIKRYATKIIASSVEFLERKGQSDDNSHQYKPDDKSHQNNQGAPFDDSIPF